MTTPKSVSRPTSAKSTSKTLATPKNLFSPCPASGREAARLAKLQSTAERLKKVSHLKEKWAKEKEIHAQINKEKRTQELKRLQDETDAAAAARKKALDADRTYELLEKQREKELLASSLEARNQLARDLEAQSKAKRRISVFLNSKIRNAALQKEAEMKSQKQQEMVTELADRRSDFLQKRQAKAREEQNRRESMANRGIAAQMQREAEEKLAKKAAEEEASLLETRHLNWEDDHKAKQALEQQRRMSMAGRLDNWREQKHITEAELNTSKNMEKDLMKSRHLDHQDMQQYKKSLVQRDRQSLAGRLQKWREEKEDPGVKAMAAAVERELQEAELEDVRNYRSKLEQNRRDSLAYRLEKARKDRTFEAGQSALKRIVEEEERKLQEFDRMDVKNYRQRLLEDRRKSIQYRNEVEIRERKRLAAEQDLEKQAQQEELNATLEDWRAVKAYQNAQREAERRSLAGRIAESHRQKELDLEHHRQMMDAMHMDFELRRLDHLEMREFREEEKVRSRRSIALRLASWKDDKIRKEKERAKEEMERFDEAMAKEQDREDLHAAKLAMEMMERQSLLTGEMKN
eukprot:CAMPEP_0170386926 /NCGR_PEP_ID=MMETSP0117_2-20130122/17293_1 /TAXON_ID=400756 /ORGANISM="Durinskia baltica, Strain CSIRO CS-38" /LENGTH=576 /DNA_ID=CAMNT_0010642777 /DNA_START=136 /DNA_END=1866 /DNA_ORIENTATION=-